MTVRILPSVLSADFARLADDVAMCEAGGADWLHVDVMDGQFVPNLTFGAKVIATVRKLTQLPLDVHLMVWHPERYFDDFVAAGASRISIHAEATPHLHRHVQRIKELGAAAGVVINPATPVDALTDIVGDVDTVLIMSVDPGFGGQQFIPRSLDKIQRARQLLRQARSAAVLEVDGGINRTTIAQCARAGADTFVAGQAVFGATDPRAEIGELRRLALETTT